jgi:hypothetical protein
MPRDLRWKGELFIFEDVPMGVCVQCGEKVLKPEVAKLIDRILTEQRKPVKIMHVPVYQYEAEAA